MNYSVKQNCAIPAQEIFSTCKSILMPLNYRIVEQSDTTLIFEGGGLVSTKQNPMLGATKIAVIRESMTLEVYAQMHGVRFMLYFLLLFPVLLGCILGGIFYVLGIGNIGFTAIALSLAPWIILSPLLGLYIKKRTTQALDTFAHNIILAHNHS
ncbi:MAG: hypothetical protein GY729_22210 [Desulfobacteraceae bacterium]|nr:hypothetical protein [Desulfobacteraceae bacterium]